MASVPNDNEYTTLHLSKEYTPVCYGGVTLLSRSGYWLLMILESLIQFPASHFLHYTVSPSVAFPRILLHIHSTAYAYKKGNIQAEIISYQAFYKSHPLFLYKA